MCEKYQVFSISQALFLFHFIFHSLSLSISLPHSLCYLYTHKHKKTFVFHYPSWHQNNFLFFCFCMKKPSGFFTVYDRSKSTSFFFCLVLNSRVVYGPVTELGHAHLTRISFQNVAWIRSYKCLNIFLCSVLNSRVLRGPTIGLGYWT